MLPRRAVGLLGVLVIVAAATVATAPVSAQVMAPKVENVPIPAGVDPSVSRSRSSRNIPRRRVSSCSATAISRCPNARRGRRPRAAPGPEVGSGFNTVRVYDGIAYLGGLQLPPTLFGVAHRRRARPAQHEAAQLHPVQSRHALQLPARQPREEDPHLRPRRRSRGNPTSRRRAEPQGRRLVPRRIRPAQAEAKSRSCRLAPDGKAHGLDADDRYVYSCGQFSTDLQARSACQIIDYSDPANIRQVGDLARARADEGRAVRAAQPARSRRQAADHPVPRDRLLQRPPLCGVARRRHGDPRRQGSHHAEAARDLRLRAAVPRRRSSAPRTRRCRWSSSRASIRISSSTPTRSSTARQGSGASWTSPT